MHHVNYRFWILYLTQLRRHLSVQLLQYRICTILLKLCVNIDFFRIIYRFDITNILLYMISANKKSPSNQIAIFFGMMQSHFQMKCTYAKLLRGGENIFSPIFVNSLRPFQPYVLYIISLAVLALFFYFYYFEISIFPPPPSGSDLPLV